MPVSIVTGAASGIGAATCQTLRDANHRVIGIDLRDSDILADLSLPAGRAAAVAAALQACDGALDHLVCCAGLGPAKEPGEIVAVNYFGATALLDGLYEALQQGSKPSALVVASVAAVSMDFDNHPLLEAFLAGDEAAAAEICAAAGEMGSMLAYAGSKHAVVCDMRRRAMSWGKAGVRLNAVAPGPIVTPLLQECVDDVRFSQNIGEFIPPIGHQGQPQEVADLIAFLLSDKARSIHASVHFIDGGAGALMRPTKF